MNLLHKVSYLFQKYCWIMNFNFNMSVVLGVWSGVQRGLAIEGEVAVGGPGHCNLPLSLTGDLRGGDHFWLQGNDHASIQAVTAGHRQVNINDWFNPSIRLMLIVPRPSLGADFTALCPHGVSALEKVGWMLYWGSSTLSGMGETTIERHGVLNPWAPLWL